MGRVTITDVARTAGVSMKSVSRVVNSEANVSARLRARVNAAIDSLGYVPHQAARSLAGGRALTIGLLFDNPSPHYTLKIQVGAYQACREHHYHLSIEHLNLGAGNEAHQVEDILRNVRVDGFVVTPPLTDSEIVLDALEARGIPYVRIAPVSFPRRSPAFAIDDDKAARVVAEHLWSLGHRRFGLVNGPSNHGAAARRRQGFLAALSDHGCTSIAETNAGFDFERGISAALELVSLPQPATAIFAANDDSAAGVMSGLAQCGLRVPEHVSVVGFDDSWIARAVWPYLTTIHQPIAEMAYAATQHLIRSYNVKPAPRDAILLPFELIMRSTTAVPEKRRQKNRSGSRKRESTR
ncbi:MAG: LacI family DNA-binding transcriptional regulator [Pseudomonadota bacterium]